MLALAFCFFSCTRETTWDCIQSTGKRVIEEYRFDNKVQELSIHDDVILILHNSDEQYFELETGENMVPEINLDLEGNRLTVTNDNTCRWSRNPGNVRLHAYLDTLSLLQKNGFENIYSEDSITFSFRLETYAPGTVELHLNNRVMQIKCSSLNNFKLTGTTFGLGLYMVVGDGIFQAEDLLLENATLVHSGINSLHVNVANTLTYYIWDDGDIVLHREPQELVEGEKTGSGEIILMY